jgi:hypothetical protein
MTVNGCEILHMMADLDLLVKDNAACMSQIRRQADVILTLSERLRAAGLPDSIGENDKPNLVASKESK